ncbi:hypothetical protein Tco_0128628 [Tanacetum coccineum]
MSARPSRPAAPTAGVGSLLPNICPSFHFIGSVIYLTRFQWFFSPVLCLLWFISWTMRLPPSIASLSTYAETNTMDQRESIRQSKYENLVVHLSAGQLLFQSWGRGKDEEGAGGKRYYIKGGFSPMSTSIDQDAPLTSIPSSQEQEHSLIISQGFEESPKTPTFHDDPLNESPNVDFNFSTASSSKIDQFHHSSFETPG